MDLKINDVKLSHPKKQKMVCNLYMSVKFIEVLHITPYDCIERP